MKELQPRDPQPRQEAREVSRAPVQGASARHAGAAPAQVLRLQRLAGNRATVRTLARWSPHPDKEKKGVWLPDSAAAEFNRFNPPKNQ
jgi:hypothetical protein